MSPKVCTLSRAFFVCALLLFGSVSAMKTKVIGEAPHELTVSEVCLGTMTFGEQTSEAEAHAQLDIALENGVNFIDTAELYPVVPSRETYGLTEVIIGKWLAKDPTRRGKVILASKVAGIGRDYIPELRRRDLLAAGQNLDGPVPDGTLLTREQIFEALEASLVRLQTSYSK